MKPPYNHTLYKVTTTRNAYGDFTGSGEVAIPCHFRYITLQSTNTNNEVVDCDAMAWVDAKLLDRKDIIKFENEYFRVEKVIHARRLRNPDIQFTKVELLRYGTIS